MVKHRFGQLGFVGARWGLAAVLCALVISVGCKPELLPNTDIEDNGQNKAVVDFVEEYRKAMESRQSDEVLQLVAEEYFEDMGTEDQKDDYGIERLRERLTGNFEHTEALQLKVYVQKIEHEGEDERIAVYYHYLQRALLAMPAGKEWVSHSDRNRLVLKKRGDNYSDGFLILSGL